MQKVPNKRRIILFLLLLAFGFYVATHYKELIVVIDTLLSGSWRWLLLAILLQIAHFYTYIRMVRHAFLTVGIERRIQDLIPLVFGALFVNVLAPTGGNSGAILFADDAARRKESSTKAVVGHLVSTISSYSSFLTLLVFAIIFLKLNNLLNSFEIIGAAIFLIPVFLPTILIIFAIKKPNRTHQILAFIRKTLNKIFSFLHIKKKITENWEDTVAEELKTAGESIGRHPKELFLTISIALIAHLLNILSLWAIFISFDILIHYGAMIAGYVFAEVIRVISPHPEGVGAVEAAIVLILSSFGVPPISATAIAITFRGLNFWAPLGLGFFYLRKLKSFK